MCLQTAGHAGGDGLDLPTLPLEKANSSNYEGEKHSHRRQTTAADKRKPDWNPLQSAAAPPPTSALPWSSDIKRASVRLKNLRLHFPQSIALLHFFFL
jgi:hypothetical protein